ncbi:glycine N-acyltransferase-like protein 3 [Pectinophora gossypiella]|uniref:glycine N-acyltransferase-like protein 3 n=1 Tax=Pectinophora gossypiella TaxID=13191 RepID=UPI00214E8401|nr:glycine N-acyltransferase-like protein 3 [Pectinophora gossypiella]XP_049876663.1 glycine N-acyltransferase-like protein 3 [Pectinophora gossypiella]XP_049876664.1 glycine N-acyltransferase-like protein 3 [Pectinophora gossypiella]XP_049876665.1 glycine N-acyltransferase-like protein 3 [Pectinophora gossypiella]
MEPLVEIPRESWPALEALYADRWPDGAVAYCILNMHLIKPNLKDAFEFKVYCPEGKLHNGMIGISLRQEYYQIMIQPLEDVAQIQNALLTTKLINWNRNIMVPSANDATIQCLEKIKNELGINVYYGKDTIAYKHILRNNSKKFDDIILPPNTNIGPLKPKHLEIVDKTWMFHGDGTCQFFDTLLRNDMTYVLYSSEGETSETPLAWVTVGDHGSLTHLYCLEEHRRKGYSELVTKYAANDLLEKGHHVLAYTVDSNERAQNLFRKLGFQDVGYDYWVVVNTNKC